MKLLETIGAVEVYARNDRFLGFSAFRSEGAVTLAELNIHSEQGVDDEVETAIAVDVLQLEIRRS